MRRYVHVLVSGAFMLLGCGVAYSQNWAVGVNMADMLNLGTVSVGASVATGRHLTIDGAAAINPWTFNKGQCNQMQNKQQTYSLGVRYWPLNVYSGWWVSGELQFREYNSGGIISSKTEEGDMAGIGIGGGYSLMLGRHLCLDFGLGLWGGYKRYDIYACTNCGKRIDYGSKWFILPDELIIALVWIF